METEITFVGGRIENFDQSAEIKMTPFGVEIIVRTEEEPVRVLFPWAQIEKITQRGATVSAIYTY
jgi:hypothetical protein